MKTKYISTLFVVALALSGSTTAQGLTLEQFKSEVYGQDPGWKAAEAVEKGGRLLVTEADTLTALNFTSQASYLNDNRLTINPLFQGDRTEASTFYLGLTQLTNYGVQWDVLQNFQHTRIYNVSTQFIPSPDYYIAYPKIDLVISLWRNRLGSETQSQVNQVRQQALLRQKQGELQKVQKEIEIENAYFMVLSLQQSLEAESDGLKRAEKVLDWTESRIKRELADRTDIYQAQAAVTARKLAFISSKSNLAKAVEKFNSLRGIQSSELTEVLQNPNIDLDRLSLIKSQIKIRKDIQLQQYLNISNEAAARVGREKYRPRLDLSLTGYQQGQDPSQTTSVSNITSNGKDYFLASITLTLPLDQSRESHHREGYEDIAKGQALTDQSRLSDQRVDWESNVDLALQLHDQITAVRELELQQKNKADAEREKFNKGRSTLFQVLSYEQDYFAAREQKIGLELQAHQFLAQQSLYE